MKVLKIIIIISHNVILQEYKDIQNLESLTKYIKLNETLRNYNNQRMGMSKVKNFS